MALSVALWKLRRPPPLPPQRVIGILPLTVTGPASNFTGETIRGELADALAQMPNVQVRAAHSLTPEMGVSTAALRQAAQSLQLTMILTGTLSLSTQDFHFDLEVVNGQDGNHLRSFHFDGPLIGLPNLPSQVEAALFHSMDGPEHAPFLPSRMQGGTQQPQAYSDAFQPSQYLVERTRNSLEQAAALFTRATTLDPDFARAFSGLAESDLVLADLETDRDVSQHFEHARMAATRAIQLDPGDARSHSVLGLVLFQRDWKLTEAEQELRTAIHLNSGLTSNHMRLAILLTDKGDFAAAKQEIALAHSLDPGWPVVYGTEMYVHIMAREYPQAIQAGRALVNMRADWGRAHQQLGWALWYGGQHAQAVHEWQQAALLDHNTRLLHQETAGLDLLEQSGIRAYAQAKLQDAETSKSSEDFVPAEWHAFAGDREATLAALETLVGTRDPESLKIPVNPAYDFLRNDARFTALLTKLST